MKKFLILLMIAAIAFCAVGCSKTTEPTEEATAEPVSQQRTLPPEDQPSELEWAPVDCNIELQHNGERISGADGFETFAMSDRNALVFHMDEATAGALSALLTDGGQIAVVLNGEPLKGTLTYDEELANLTIKGGYTFDELCEIANTIRGFSD